MKLPDPLGKLLDPSRSSLRLASWTPVAWIVAVAVVYSAIAFAFLPQDVFWSPDTGMKYLQMQNLRWDDGFQASLVYPGRELDPDLRLFPLAPLYYRVQEGKIEAVSLPYFPLISKLVVTMLSDSGFLMVPVLSGVVTVVGSFWLARLVGLTRPWTVIPVAAFMTPLIIYSVVFWEHTVFTALTTMGLGLLLWGERHRHLRACMAAGILFGLSPFLRPEAYLFALAAFLAYLAHRTTPSYWRGAAIWGVMLSLGILALWALNRTMFGSTLSTHETRAVQGFNLLTYLDRAGIAVVQHFLVGDNVRGSHAVLFLISAAGLIASTRVPAPYLRAVLLLVGGLAYAAAAALILQASAGFNYLHGLLSVSPFLIFSLAPGHDALKDVAAAGWVRTTALIDMTAGGIFATAVFGQDLGGLEWGPRYFLPVYPLLAPLAVAGFLQVYAEFPRVTRAAGLAIALSLLFVSFSMQAQGLIHIREEMMHNDEIRRLLQGEPDTVVTDLWWLPEIAATEFYNKQIFVIEQETLFLEWLTGARNRDVEEFWFLSFLSRSQNPLFTREHAWPIRVETRDVQHTSHGLLSMRLAIVKCC